MGGIWQGFIGFLASILSGLTNLTGNLGIAIILFTVLVRLCILPLTIRQLKSSRKMQELQPMMADLRRKYGKDQQRLQEETMKLYRENKVNPVGGCLPLLIQLPIFLGVYNAIIQLVQAQTVALAAKNFLGINLVLSTWQGITDTINATTVPSFVPGFQGLQYLILPVLSVLLQLLVSLMAMPKIQDPQQKAMSQAMLFLPLVFGYIGFTFNQGAVLYWVAGSVFSIVQQYFISGFGSLTNYLPFLPDRKGLFPPAAPIAATAAVGAEGAGDAAPAEPQRDFWAPLNKLNTAATPATDASTEQAIADTKRQLKRR
jgi:YidC/Oxa1 family membrane protein insertase